MNEKLLLRRELEPFQQVNVGSGRTLSVDAIMEVFESFALMTMYY